MTFDGGSPFRIKRPLITTSGFVSDVDGTIKTHLDELNTILGRRILVREAAEIETIEELDETIKISRHTKKRGAKNSSVIPDIQSLLTLQLTPKKTPGNNWATDSLVYTFNEMAETPDQITLAEYIDMTAELSALKYDFQSNISANWFNLDYNTKTVLDGYPAISDYLIAYGYHVMNLTEVNGLKNFILSNRLGAKNGANYAIVSAARTIIDSEQLKVPGYNDDGSDIVARILSGGLSLSSASFNTGLHAIINDDIFNGKEAKLIDNAGVGLIPPGMKPLLIKYIKTSPVPITAANIKFFLPQFILQIQSATVVSKPTEVDIAQSDKDFDVDFLTDDNSVVQISASAVKCAAQLYYDMVLGDELDVFDVMNYFTHKYLIRGQIEIQDATLRDDLQLYVFSNKFTDLKTNKINDRTRPAERQMFYRQVFDNGNGQVTEDVIVNKEFPKLWKVLVLESAKYLERAQASFNPDSYVSRQNVMQAVEDLQYNLSTHCTGMANVVTPLIYGELNFIIQRVLMHPEVVRQIVPQGGTWWRVVELLYMGMKHARPKSTVLYNKAKLGNAIIRSIADYNPATFEDDANFSAFISNVDAFITTQSILQEALTDDLTNDHQEEEAKEREGRQPALPTQDAPALAGPKADAGEWDF
jgi:hypothetical protein